MAGVQPKPGFHTPRMSEQDRTSEAALRVLIITASTRDYRALSECLKGPGWNLQWAPDIDSGLHLLRSRPLDVVIYDARLATGCAVRILECLRSHPTAPFLIAACPEGDIRSWEEALALGVRDAVILPFDAAEVLNVLRTAWVTQHRQRHESGCTSAVSAGW